MTFENPFYSIDGTHPIFILDGPGWYFYDEIGDTYGPFSSKEEAAELLQLYCAEIL